MSTYRIKVSAIIQAPDADAAYVQLCEHLKRLANHEWSDLVEPGTEAVLDEVEDEPFHVAYQIEEQADAAEETG